MLAAACYWPPSQCFLAHKFMFMSASLNHNRSQLGLDSDIGRADTTPLHSVHELDGRQLRQSKTLL